ncbi:MAG: hypothetical protein INH02_06530 [Gemmatimonas sp.]|uniref:hypothetical protein n=1 Tax=Gemmatimonas sp. TaxID=1962908 RepID=UPI0025C246F1|nr:hypothetical protein [Gemmatimonas sp.]MCA2987059.1 hypothetical protein [Gemmatimonas sp.]
MSTASSTDAFARVCAAFVAAWPGVADPAAPTRAEVGRVLDECGSDYRPLVELVIDLGRVVRPPLASLPPQTAASWVHARAPLVHRLVSTRYLQPDVARWAVDVWGQLLGIVPASVVAPPSLESAAAPGAAAAAGVAAARPASATAPSAHAAAPQPRVLAPQQVPAALKQTPSWAGGPVSFRVGQKPKASTLAAMAQSGRVVVRGAPVSGPRFQPAERFAALILALLLVLITGGLLNEFRKRPDVPAPADAMPVAEGALAPAAPAPAPEAAATAIVAAAAAAPPVDTTVRPLASPDDSRERPDIPGVKAFPPSLPVRETGVAGSYLVTQRVRDVSGSTSCDAVAQALANGRESEERVVHTPGAPTFVLSTRRVAGTLDRDGTFVSEPRAGTTNNVNWRFQMRGRFGPDGFTGESVTHTDAILRWGKIQTCVVTAELTGRRRLP